MLRSNIFFVFLSFLTCTRRAKPNRFLRLPRTLSLASFLLLCLNSGCVQPPSVSQDPPSPPPPTEPAEVAPPAPVVDNPNQALLSESWDAYRKRFIQSDGRVIDWESNSRTVSEGQAYAMLRAVMADDPAVFEKTLFWAEENLKRNSLPNDEDGQDTLWAWKWGERPDGSWGIQDPNFASDADIDAITALILADRQWNRPDYLELARQKLDDLWAQSVYTAASADAREVRHYLLPGPLQAFQAGAGKIYINPSYLAPYAFRLFAQVESDASQDWMALIDSSYDILAQTQQISPQGIPADWIILNATTETIQPSPAGSRLQSRYGFDAYRVWWRVAWDFAWFEEPRAREFLVAHLPYFQSAWQTESQISAILSLSGDGLVDYESTSQYAMLYPAFQQVNPEVADAILDQKLLSTYDKGIWDDADAYYVQNLAWFGLYPINILRSISEG